jgi:mannose-6-phosphate isomerase-like protein (cupin superfamily)
MASSFRPPLKRLDQLLARADRLPAGHRRRPTSRGRRRGGRNACAPAPSQSAERRGRRLGSSAASTLAKMDALEVEKARQRLVAARGGYEIIHHSPGLEVGVYVLVAPEPDHQGAHVDDELYVVLEGRGTLTVEAEAVALSEGQAAFVPAGAQHQFTGYEGLSVLVIFSRQREPTPLAERRATPHPI